MNSSLLSIVMTVTIRKPEVHDKNAFLQAMHRSQALHHPWVQPPQTEEEFNHYLQRYQQENQKSFLVCDPSGHKRSAATRFPALLTHTPALTSATSGV